MSRKRIVKVTRQGVRDLNALPGKSRGYRLPDMPGEVDANCRHQWIDDGYHLMVCEKCKESRFMGK